MCECVRVGSRDCPSVKADAAGKVVAKARMVKAKMVGAAGAARPNPERPPGTWAGAHFGLMNQKAVATGECGDRRRAAEKCSGAI